MLELALYLVALASVILPYSAHSLQVEILMRQEKLLQRENYFFVVHVFFR